MARHSKHSNDRSFYSHNERKDAGFAGNRKEILGSDCFLPFGFCCLSLKPPKNPVVTPDGYIYDREHILEYLLTQKLELQSKAKKFEAQEQRKARKVQADIAAEEVQKIVEFQEADQGLLSQDLRHKRAIDKSEAAKARLVEANGGYRGVIEDDAERPEKRLRAGELLVIDKSKQREKSFWAKECTPNSAPTDLAKVDTTVRCPMSGKKLKVKDLVPLKFDVTDQKILDKGGDKGVFCCAISKHPIVHQKAVLIKPSGQVVMESVLKDMVLKDMVCPITSIKLSGPEDILKLQAGGTGFSAHNDIEAKLFKHIRSRDADDRTRQGHLPKGGFVGLL